MDDDMVCYFDMINRHALIVQGKKPFFDWINATSPDHEPVNPKRVEKNIYLIPSFDFLDDTREWIKENFDLIFENELNDWYTNKTKWPRDRTDIMFKKWFEVEMVTLVRDVLDEPVFKK